MGQKKRGDTTHNLRTTSATLREKLLEKFNFACINCGIANSEIPLQLAHLVAVTSGGETTEENLTVLCPNCHAQFDRKPREIEFVSFLSELLKEHPNYKEVNQEVLLGGGTRFRGDILVKRKLPNASVTLLIECKTSIGYFNSRIAEILNQLIS